MPHPVHLIGQGIGGADIKVRISYQTHVFLRRHKGEPGVFVFRDEAGLPRQFCVQRFEQSLELPAICRTIIENDHLTWESHDKNRSSNLAVVGADLISGPNYIVVYYLFPSRSDHFDVELVVKSAYSKDIDFESIRRRYKVHQLIKKSYFNKVRVPK